MIATSYRYIVQKAGVRSGHAVVEGTRIGVHDVVAMTKAGASVDEIVGKYLGPERGKQEANTRTSAGL